MLRKNKINIDIDNIFLEIAQINPQNYSFEEAFFILYDNLQKLYYVCDEKYSGGNTLSNWHEYEHVVTLIFQKFNDYEEFEKFIQFKVLYEELKTSKMYKELNLTDTYFLKQKISENAIFEGYIESFIEIYMTRNKIEKHDFSIYFLTNTKLFYENSHKKELEDLLKIFAIKINKEETKNLKTCKSNFNNYFNSTLIGSDLNV